MALTSAASFYVHVFIDKEYHVEGPRLERFAWFRRKRQLHFAHHLPPGHVMIASTLDACRGGFDDRIAKALVESGIKATIFVTGVWLRENPIGLAFLLAHRDLFAIENHGERHIPPVLGRRRISPSPPLVILPPCGATLPPVRCPSGPQPARRQTRPTAISRSVPGLVKLISQIRQQNDKSRRSSTRRS